MRPLAYAGAVAAVAAVLYVLAPPFWKHLLSLSILFGALVAVYDFFYARAGYVNLGYTFVIGLAGYAVALLTNSPGLGVLAAVLGGIAGAAPLGLLSLRFRGPFYAVATLVLPLILIYLARSAYAVFKGDDGIGLWHLANLDRWYGLAAAFAAFHALVALANSRLGLLLSAIGQDEALAESSGINVAKVKIVSNIFSGALAGLITFFFVSYVGLMSTALIEPIPYLVYILLACGLIPGGVIPAFVVGAVVYVADTLLRAAAPGVRLVLLSFSLIVVFLFAARRYARD